MTQTLESQWGREPLTVDATVPTVALNSILGWTHVGTSDADVEADVRERLAKVDDGRWTPALVEQTVAAALWIHAENRALYVAVTSGRI